MKPDCDITAGGATPDVLPRSPVLPAQSIAEIFALMQLFLETITAEDGLISEASCFLSGGQVMQVSELEALAARLHSLREKLHATSVPGDKPLAAYDPLVQAAKECEFMLPSVLTAHSLLETVDRKIGNVEVLLARARTHEDLPEAAQVAAEQEYMATREDYLGSMPDQDMRDQSVAPR